MWKIGRSIHVALKDFWGFDLIPDPIKASLKYAQKALELDNNDAEIRGHLASVYIARKDHERAVRECQAALSINPSSYRIHNWYGVALVWSGKFEKAISMLEMALRLSPNDPDSGVTYTRMTEAYIGLGQFDRAVETAQIAATKPKRGFLIPASLVAALAHAGQLAEARQALQELFERIPTLICANFKDRLLATDPHLIAVYVDGLRKAGVPEE